MSSAGEFGAVQSPASPETTDTPPVAGDSGDSPAQYQTSKMAKTTLTPTSATQYASTPTPTPTSSEQAPLSIQGNISAHTTPRGSNDVNLSTRCLHYHRNSHTHNPRLTCKLKMNNYIGNFAMQRLRFATSSCRWRQCERMRREPRRHCN